MIQAIRNDIPTFLFKPNNHTSEGLLCLRNTS